MQLFDPNNPNERNKAIAAGVLAVAAIAVLGYVFLGGSSSSNKANANAPTPKPTQQAGPIKPVEAPPDPETLTPIPASLTVVGGAEASRNIFAYYEPTPTPIPYKPPPSPSPTPTPPLSISSLMPSQVYARTADFKLQVMGDKFTPAVRIYVDNREMPTQFVNAQQLATTVPASLISSPGSHNVVARSSDGALYSLSSTLNVAPPPLPNYTFIGIIGKPRANDIALLLEKGAKEPLNVQRGDVLGGRFRVTSISERELVLTDITLKIKHTLPFTIDAGTPGSFRPGPTRNADDEP